MIEPKPHIRSMDEVTDPHPSPPPEDAPYGYKKDGTPKKRPGRPSGYSSSTSRRKRSVESEEESRALSARLTKTLGRAAAFPAVPLSMMPLDPAAKAYLTTHFTHVGPHTAHMLVQASETSPRLREVLERLASGSSSLDAAVAVGLYLGPPVMFMVGMRLQAGILTRSVIEDIKGPEVADQIMEDMVRAATGQTAAMMADDGTVSESHASPQPESEAQSS